MTIVTRQQVDAVQGTLSGWKTAEVDIPELGEGAVALVRELSSSEKEHVSFGILNREGKVDYRLIKGMEDQVVAYGWVDETGKRLFSNKETKPISGMPSNIVNRLSQKIRELSGLVKSDDVIADVSCPHCGETFPVNLTELTKAAGEKEEPEKN